MKLTIEHQVTIHADGVVTRLLEGVFGKLECIERKEDKLMSLIDDLTEDVAKNTSAVDSAVKLLGNLSALLAEAGTDPVKLAALKAALDSNTQALASAVAANTPAEPTP